MNKKSSTSDLALSSNERLSINNKSLFSPKKYLNLKPNGLKIYTFHSGFKKKNDDLLIIIFDQPVNTAVVYSKTTTPSAPIIWDKKFNCGNNIGLIVNSGNANAHTGKKGLQIIDQYTKYLSKNLGCKKNQILVSSTGVIGEIFDPRLIINQINKIKQKKPGTLIEAAKSIMTTDTYPKLSIKDVKINNSNFKIYGIAKGSGMIHPNMGTMLAFIFIEADLSKKILNNLLQSNLGNTFNSISIDSDTSTSDTLAFFSIKKNKINFNNKKNYNILNKSIFNLMLDLLFKDCERR